MLATINLDHQPGLQAGKVDDVVIDGDLAAEAKPIDLPLAQ